MASARQPGGWLLYGVQFFFGGWFLLHGLNHWLEFFPRPSGSSALTRELIGALNHSGLFVIVKGLEVVAGLLMLLNRFVPLAIVLAVPVTFSIAHLNLVANSDPTSVAVGILSLILLAVLAWGYLDRYKPMLTAMSAHPNRPQLDMPKQVLAVLAGIIAPLVITFWSTSSTGPRSAAQAQAVAAAIRAPRDVVLDALRASRPAALATEMLAAGDRVISLGADRTVEVFRVNDGRIVEQWSAAPQSPDIPAAQ